MRKLVLAFTLAAFPCVVHAADCSKITGDEPGKLEARAACAWKNAMERAAAPRVEIDGSGYTRAQCNLILNRNGTDAQRAACMYPNDKAKRVEFMREMALTRAANPNEFTIRNR
jgi:hypothetical protein